MDEQRKKENLVSRVITTPKWTLTLERWRNGKLVKKYSVHGPIIDNGTDSILEVIFVNG